MVKKKNKREKDKEKKSLEMGRNEHMQKKELAMDDKGAWTQKLGSSVGVSEGVEGGSGRVWVQRRIILIVAKA